MYCITVSRIFPTFSSSIFSVSGLMLRSRLHVNLTFVAQGNKYGSICIRVQVDIQLDQHHLLKMLSIFPLHAFFVKTSVGGFVSGVLGLQFDSTDELVHFLTNTMQFFKNCDCSMVCVVIQDGHISRNYFIIQY